MSATIKTQKEFLSENAEEIRRLKRVYLPEIVDKRGNLRGLNGRPGVPKDICESADKIIRQAQEYGFFKDYQGFTSYRDEGDCYFLIHSSPPRHYNADHFGRDVEYICGEEEVVRKSGNQQISGDYIGGDKVSGDKIQGDKIQGDKAGRDIKKEWNLIKVYIYGIILVVATVIGIVLFF